MRTMIFERGLRWPLMLFNILNCSIYFSSSFIEAFSFPDMDLLQPNPHRKNMTVLHLLCSLSGRNYASPKPIWSAIRARLTVQQIFSALDADGSNIIHTACASEPKHSMDILSEILAIAGKAYRFC